MILVWMFTLHLVADFFMQSREMGTKKSSDLFWLRKHLEIITTIFALGLVPFFGLKGCWFALANTTVHGIIDWNIWKLYKLSAHKRILKELNDNNFPTDGAGNVAFGAAYQEKVKNWRYWEDSKFYDTIGTDQYLHAITIIILAYAMGMV